MGYGKYFWKQAAVGTGLLFLSAAPVAAQCVIGKDEILEPFTFGRNAYEIVHKDSGFVFPTIAAGFQRECEMTTDFTGNNFEIGYVKKIGDHKVDVKIVVIHLEDLTARDHYLIVKPDVMSHYSSASTISEGEYFVSGRPNLDSYQGIFDGEYKSTPWHFSVTAIDYGYWDARLIASYPQEIDELAQEGLMELITAFQWQTPVEQKQVDQEK